jgi:ESCRT-II complex subunit VPS36
MVALAERIRARLAGPGGGAEEGEGSRQDMQDLLLSVGIASPVTRENAGALYHQQLSRQVRCVVGTSQKSSSADEGRHRAAESF